MLKYIVRVVKEYPMVRGMLAYSVLWPIGSIITQTFVEGKNYTNYDYLKCARFSAYGAFLVGPTLYMWMRVASVMWPSRNIKASLCKAFTEQVAYDPFAISCFLYTMTLCEGKTVHQASLEVQEKFVETYKVGFVYWPTIQTINFSLIPAKNQIIFASVFSLIWTTFLAYMKHIEIHHLKEKKSRAKEKDINCCVKNDDIQKDV